MAGQIKGIIVEIGGNTVKLTDALNSTQKHSRNLQKELRGVNSLLKFDPTNTELLAQKQEILTEEIENTGEKLTKLKSVQKQVQEQFDKGKITKEQYRDFQREIINTENKLKGLKEEQKEFGSVAKQQMEKAAQAADELGDKLEDAGSKLNKVSAGVAAAGAALAVDAMNTESTLATMQGQLNLTEAETEKLTAATKKVYTDGYGESLDECKSAIVLLNQNIKQSKDLSEDQQVQIAEQMINMRTLFDAENEELTKTLSTMLNNDMVSSIQEGLDVLTVGYQNGANYSGELLDTMREYSPQFKALGLDANAAMSYLIQGAQNGAFNLDKVGDAMKEFSIRAIDGSDTTKEGFKIIGLNANEMAKKFAAGGDTAKKAFKETLEALNAVEDPLKQNTAGVDLFGTMWEDLGSDTVLSLSQVTGALQNVEGATKKAGEQLDESFSSKGKSILRELKESVQPIGEDLLEVAEDVLPEVKEAISDVSDIVGNLTEEQIELILKLGGIVAVSGPTVSAIGKVTKALSSLKSIGAFTAPVLSLVAAAVGMYMYGAEKAKWETSELVEEIQDSVEEYRNLKEATDEVNEAADIEADKLNRLWDELDKIVDKNGEVKEGYETRANYITGELSSALGIEIEIVDGVIQKYDTLRDSIDKLIEKKRAEAILAQQEINYGTAWDNITEAEKKQQELMTELKEAQAEYQRELEEFEAEGGDTRLPYDYFFYLKRIGEKNAAKGKLDEVTQAYLDNGAVIKGYYEDIALYEKNYAAILDENYDAIVTNIEEVGASYDTVAQKADSMSQKIDSSIDKSKQSNAELAENTEEKSAEIAESLKGIQAENKKVGDSYTENKDKAIEGFKEFSEFLENDALPELNGLPNLLEQIGKDSADGYISGLHSREAELKRGIYGFSDLVIGAFKSPEGFDINSPSKKTIRIAEETMDGFPIGFDRKKNVAKSKILGISKEIIDASSAGMTAKEISIPITARNAAVSNAIIGAPTTKSSVSGSQGKGSVNVSKNIVIPLYIDGKKFAETVAPYSDSVNGFRASLKGGGVNIR